MNTYRSCQIRVKIPQKQAVYLFFPQKFIIKVFYILFYFMYSVKSNHANTNWNLMTTELKLYYLCFLLFVIGFLDQYKTIY